MKSLGVLVMVFVLLTTLSNYVTAQGENPDLNWPEQTMYKPDYSWFTQQRNLSYMALSPDQRTIATTGSYEDHGVNLYDIYGHFIADLPAHKKSVWCVAFSPDGAYIFSGSDDRTIEQWSITKREKVATYTGHKDFIWSIDISPNGEIMASSGSHSGAIRLWSTRTKQLIKILGEEKVNDNFLPWVGPTKFLNNNELITGCSDGLKIWDISKGSYSFLYGGHRLIYSLAVSLDKNLLASGSRDGSFCIWNLSNRSLEKMFSTPGGAIYSIAFISKNIIVMGRDCTTADLYNWNTGQNLLELRDHGGPVMGVVVTSQNILTASGYPEGVVRIWNISKIVPTLQPQYIIAWGKMRTKD